MKLAYNIIGVDKNKIVEENETGTITVSDLNGVFTIELDDSNIVYMQYGKVDWLQVIDKSNLKQTKIEVYYDNNLTPKERTTYINLINKQTGDIDTYFVTQEACYYRIEEIKILNEFNDKKTPFKLTFNVYGNTCKCNITDSHFHILKKENVYFPFDKGLSYVLKKENTDVDEDGHKYITYSLLINYVGNISDLTEEDKYVLTLQHNDDRKTREDIDISIEKIILSEKASNKDGILKDIIGNLPDSINKYQNDNDNARDNEYLDLISENVSDSNVINTLSKQVREIEMPKLPALVVNRIENNIIYIQTNTYNRQNILEHDSLIAGSHMALWCSIKDMYDKELEQHEIMVKCKPNHYGVERKSYLILTNVERLSDRQKFIIVQTENNEIKIKHITD